jgi:hypothetical protein
LKKNIRPIEFLFQTLNPYGNFNEIPSLVIYIFQRFARFSEFGSNFSKAIVFDMSVMLFVVYINKNIYEPPNIAG